MSRRLTLLAVAGAAAPALALAVPVTTHAQQEGPPGTTGPCGFSSPKHAVQHTGVGHHAFSGDSDNNCVNFTGAFGTAFLDDSDFNLMNIGGFGNTVNDFKNSDHNTINFDNGTAFDTLSARNANGNFVEFTGNASNDVVTLLGLTDSSVDITGSSDFLLFDASCSGNQSYTLSGQGTRKNPILVC
jgi:hypothetical protein